VPARNTALLIALTGGAPPRALRVALRDARHHSSPNAGWPEAALAGALNVRLGGPNRYAGVRTDGAFFNAGGRTPNAADVRTAIRTVARTTLLAHICAVAARA
jgi:adenosylcobinamide-phosphate synthase